MRFAVPIRGVSVKGDEQMVAVSDAGLALRAEVSIQADSEPVAAGRRVVAIAVSPMELLRPGSDLVRLIEGAASVDVLLACEDEPVADPSPVGLLSGGALPDAGYDDLADDPGDDAADDGYDEVRAAVDSLGIDELHVHRLALRPPLVAAAEAEADLVAALSELVGFDPEPGVHCLAPAVSGDPERSAVDRAVRRIAQVYGLSLQRYRCLELSVVDGDRPAPSGDRFVG
jgi:hypothetical protein